MPALDISEDQVLIDFFADPNGFRWHHCFLLRAPDDAAWILCAPDGRVQRCNLADHRIIVLPRNAAFPQDRINEIYGCDAADFDDANMCRLRREANALALLLGAPAPAQGSDDSDSWRIRDTTQ